MELTPEQKNQVHHAKERGEQRVTVQFTSEQRKTYQETVEQELAGKDENIAQMRQIIRAAEQPGFFGDVRRAIIVSRRPIGELAIAIGVDPQLLSDFRAGNEEFPAGALDRLLETLGLRLMQEIRR
jgi:hypothetical protein